MFESLLTKTLFILGAQLLLTFGATWYLIDYFRTSYRLRDPGISASTNADGELDIHIEWPSVAPFFYSLIAVDLILFFVLYLASFSTGVRFSLFCLWSLVTGFELGLVLISIDENLGLRALRLTGSITLVAAAIGMYSGVNFQALEGALFIGLSVLIIWNLINCVRSFSNRAQMIGSLLGAILFSFYLVFDFNRLQLLGKTAQSNNWQSAIDMSISLYLDIINLFLEILDFLSRSGHHS